MDSDRLQRDSPPGRHPSQLLPIIAMDTADPGPVFSDARPRRSQKIASTFPHPMSVLAGSDGIVMVVWDTGGTQTVHRWEAEKPEQFKIFEMV